MDGDGETAKKRKVDEDVVRYFLNTGEEFDVRFSIKDDEEAEQIIPAHKSVISRHSPVLEARILRWDNSEPIVISGTTTDAFYEFLKFMYIGEWHPTTEMALQLLELSNLYQVTVLFEECKDVLRFRGKCPQVCVDVFLGTRLIDEELSRLAWHTVIRNAKSVVPSEDFIFLPAEAVLNLLKNDEEVPLPDEVTLYNACERWAFKQCESQNLEKTPLNIQKVIGEAFRFIRFTSLLDKCKCDRRYGCYDCRSRKSVIYKAPISNMLTDLQFETLYNYIQDCSNSLRLNDVLQWTAFVKPRPDKEFEVQRFEERKIADEKSWIYRSSRQPKWDRIGFSCDKEILISGVGYYGCSDPDFGLKHVRTRHGDSDSCYYDIKLEIKSFDREHSVLGSAQGHQLNKGEEFRMDFKTPIQIHARAKYIIASSCKGPRSFYGKEGQSSVTVNCDNYPVSFTFLEAKHTATATATGVSIGVIPNFFFKVAPDSNDVECFEL